MPGRPAKATSNELVLPSWHAGQWQVWESRKRFNWLAAGRRWRKTTFLMTIAAEALTKGQEVLWGAPTEDQCKVAFDEMRQTGDVFRFRESPHLEVSFARAGPRARCYFRSLDNPRNALGRTADLAIMDEVADIDPIAWYEVVSYMLTSTGGSFWGAGTPRGRNWFWREWDKAGSDADSARWQVPTLGVAVVNGQLVRAPHPLENPEMPFKEIWTRWKSRPERTFREQVLAEFIEEGAGVFRQVREVATLKPGEPEEGHRYVVGVDWGRMNDFSVFSVIDTTDMKQVWLDRSNRVEYIQQEGRLRALCELWNPDLVLAERNSIGIPIMERLLREDLPVKGFDTTAGSKMRIVDDLALAFERGRLQLLDDDVQTDELLSYEGMRLPGGLVRYSAPQGLHDDTVIALALSWQLAKGDQDAVPKQEEDEDVIDSRSIWEVYPAMGEMFPKTKARLAGRRSYGMPQVMQ